VIFFWISTDNTSMILVVRYLHSGSCCAVN
jgi:hypothetical protein